MKTKQLILLLTMLFVFLYSLKAQTSSFNSRAVVSNMCKGDNVLRYYRMALPITQSCFYDDFEGDVNNVKSFWADVEEFMNRLYVPLGFCFDVIEDNCLVMSNSNEIDDNSMNALGFGTEILNNIIGSENYDIGMWIASPASWDNKGQSLLGGVYNPANKAAAYSMKDIVTVAHEAGHLFGALHTNDPGTYTEAGLGQSVMGYGTPSNFFAIPSIEQIYSWNREHNASYYSDEARTSLVGNNGGGNYVYGIKIENSAPVIDKSNIKELYRIPRGACFAFNISATDAQGDKITYAVQPADDGTPFCAYAPSESNIVDYRPQYMLFENDDYFYLMDGSNPADVAVGKYNFYIGVNDIPESYSFVAMKESPFYSCYSISSTAVEIVDGIPFTATIAPNKRQYGAKEMITVEWGVNENYFNPDSKVRISLSDDYGKTFKYILAESVLARNGKCDVLLPNINIGNVDVDFIAYTRSLPAGIIRVEEIDGIAYTLTTLSPTDDTLYNAVGGFTVSGASTSIEHIPNLEKGTCDIFDIYGRQVIDINNLSTGIYIVNGKKLLIR